jgi:iron complex transport system ATP-binding protein
MISAENLGYASILQEISFLVPRKHLMSIAGPNGAGKSTLLSLISGDLKPTAGRVLLEAEPAHRIRPSRLARLRAVMPQSTSLAFGFTAAEIVQMGTPDDDPAQARQALQQVGALHLANRPFPQLSGGEQARVTLARVLAQDTPVILLDEPTAHLDIKHQHTVLGIARELADSGRTVIAVLHDLNLAARYSDSMAILDRGRLAIVDTPANALCPDRLTSIYGHPIGVHPHPVTGAPLCLEG